MSEGEIGKIGFMNEGES